MTLATMKPPIDDVALIIEGGGMRASYTAGAVVTLLEEGLDFSQVYGISAGTSHAVDYVSRDPERVKEAFVDLVEDPDFGGVGTFLQGRGFFNAEHLYEGIAEDLAGTDDPMAFDWDTFCANAADVHVEAFDVNTGETKRWTKADMPTLHDMMIRVRASSSLPFFMPHVVIDGREYADGGLGTSWGIPLKAAMDDGFKKFFIIRSRPRDYRKVKPTPSNEALIRAAFHKNPYVAESTLVRWKPYNELCECIEDLERSGAACVFYSDDMMVNSRERDLAKLQKSYELGYAQAQREKVAWHDFLNR